MWVLAGASNAKTIQLVNLISKSISTIVPVGSLADSIAESADGSLAVGYGDADGTVELRNGATGAMHGLVTVGAPVKAIAAGSAGQLYVLDGTATISTVNVISPTGTKEKTSFGASPAAIAVVVSPGDTALFVLESSGMIADEPLATNSNIATSTFSVGSSPVQFALNATGTTLYVLRGPPNVRTVDVVDVAKEGQTAALPAPANSVGLLVGLNDVGLYLLVGTPTVGNIQLYAFGS